MTAASAASRIHAKAEQAVKAIFAPTAAASAEATEATAEGLLAGIAEVLVQRVGAERAFEVIARQADILDRVMLDAQPPRRPSSWSCGND